MQRRSQYRDWYDRPSGDSGDHWRREFHQLKKKYDDLGRKVLYAEQHNGHLRESLQEKTELITEKENFIESLIFQLTRMEMRLDDAESSSATSQNQLREVEEKLKRREEEIVALKIQQQDLDLKQEVQRLEELLRSKEQELKRVDKKRRMRTIAYNYTVDLLDKTEAALKKCEEQCSRLEKELQRSLAAQSPRRIQDQRPPAGAAEEEPRAFTQMESRDWTGL